MAAGSRKLLVVGMDGLMYEMVDKFSREGIIPNLTALIKSGSFTKAYPSPPCDTPTNWTTIATGAWTGTHGVNSFNLHFEGEPFERAHSSRQNIFPTFESLFKWPPEQEPLNRLSRAEFLWDALPRAGKRCITVNWHGAWPPTTPEKIIVDEAGPYCSKIVRLTSPQVYASGPSEVQENRIPLTVQHASEWKNVPRSESPVLETALIITGDGVMRSDGSLNPQKVHRP